MKRTLALLAVLLVPALAGMGCSSDTTQPAADTGNTLIHGEVGAADFELTVDAAAGPGHPLEGPFTLRGTNLHYADSLHALVVDLTVRNNGRTAHPEPIVLTFVDLIPDSVTVQNPDNDVHGDGAEIVFRFVNDDGMWTPREVSLPRTVQFDVDRGVSIGFVAQLNVGQPASSDGTIGGLVWMDADMDGIVDESEAGMEGVRIALSSFSADKRTGASDDDDDDCDEDHNGDHGDDDDCDDDHGTGDGTRITRTGPDGRYMFDHLPAGSYVVSKLPVDGAVPTTPTKIYVLLSGGDDGVANFLDANFGCAQQNGPPPTAPAGASR